MLLSLRKSQPLPSFDQMVLNEKEVPKFISTSEYDVHISNWLDYFALEQFCFVDEKNLSEILSL